MQIAALDSLNLRSGLNGFSSVTASSCSTKVVVSFNWLLRYVYVFCKNITLKSNYDYNSI